MENALEVAPVCGFYTILAPIEMLIALTEEAGISTEVVTVRVVSAVLTEQVSVFPLAVPVQVAPDWIVIVEGNTITRDPPLAGI